MGGADSNEAEQLAIFEEAAAHFATIAGGEPSAADREVLTAWLLADPRHAEAYARVEGLWESASEVPELKERRDALARRLTRRDLAKGAGAILLALAGWRYLETHPFADFRTAKGERRTVTLADGSTVDLSAETRLSVEFGPTERRLVLHEGQAFFRVAREAERPFVIRAGPGTIRALGTAFDVALDDGDGRVVVTEHAVDLAVGGRREAVPAGSGASYDAAGPRPAAAVDGAAELSWREGRLTFVQAPLGRVAAEINRWRAGRLVVVGEALAARPVTMIVDVARLETLLPKLESALPVRFVAVTRWLTFVLPAG